MTTISYTMPRPFAGYSIPIPVQSCYMRDYCNRNSLPYPLPVTEFCIRNCFNALNTIVSTHKSVDLLVTSIFIFDELNLSSWPLICSSSKNIMVRAVLENLHLSLYDSHSYIKQTTAVRNLQISAPLL